MIGELMSKDVFRRSASSKESKCALARKTSARVKLVCVSDGDVGKGTSGIDVSGQKGRPNNSSLGVALRAGKILSFIWRMASLTWSGQLSGMGFESALRVGSSVVSWLGAQSRFSRPRRSLLAFSIKPFTHGA